MGDRLMRMHDVLKDRLIGLGLFNENNPEDIAFLEFLAPKTGTGQDLQYASSMGLDTRFTYKQQRQPGDKDLPFTRYGVPRFALDHYFRHGCDLSSMPKEMPPVIYTPDSIDKLCAPGQKYTPGKGPHPCAVKNPDGQDAYPLPFAHPDWEQGIMYRKQRVFPGKVLKKTLDGKRRIVLNHVLQKQYGSREQGCSRLKDTFWDRRGGQWVQGWLDTSSDDQLQALKQKFLANPDLMQMYGVFGENRRNGETRGVKREAPFEAGNRAWNGAGPSQRQRTEPSPSQSTITRSATPQVSTQPPGNPSQRQRTEPSPSQSTITRSATRPGKVVQSGRKVVSEDRVTNQDVKRIREMHPDKLKQFLVANPNFFNRIRTFYMASSDSSRSESSNNNASSGSRMIPYMDMSQSSRRLPENFNWNYNTWWNTLAPSQRPYFPTQRPNKAAFARLDPEIQVAMLSNINTKRLLGRDLRKHL